VSYDIHLNIPEDSQRGHVIASVAAQQHLTPAEAVERILDQVAQSQALSETDFAAPEPLTDEEKEMVATAMEARRMRAAERQTRREALAKARPETPDAMIGFLADAPEVAENIRRLAYERRSQAFGNI
jgi:hypothetical protein